MDQKAKERVMLGLVCAINELAIRASELLAHEEDKSEQLEFCLFGIRACTDAFYEVRQ